MKNLDRTRLAVHVHSCWSYDGNWSLREIASVFSRLQYDAVLMAEHDRTFDGRKWLAYVEACAAASSSSLTLVPGIEYSDPADLVHVPTWGAEDFLGGGRPTQELLLDARASDAVTVFAHPLRRKAWQSFDLDWLPLLSGIEVWNSRHGTLQNRTSLEFATAVRAVPSFYAIDFHSGRDLHRAAMRVDVRAPATQSAILAALSTRRAVCEMRSRGLLRHVLRAERTARRLIRGGGAES
jgi:hypothetical protein